MLLADVLAEEDRSIPRRQIRRSDNRRQDGEIASEQRPARPAGGDRQRAVLRLGEGIAIRQLARILEHDGFSAHQHAPEVIQRDGVPSPHAVGAVERDEAGLRVNGQKEGADVAVTDEDFRVAPDGVEIKIRKDTAAAPPSADRQNRPYRGIREERIDVGGPILVLTGQVPIPVKQVAANLHFEAQRLERLFRNLQFLRLKRGVGRGHESRRVAGCEPLRLDDGPALHDAARHSECRGDRGGRGPEKLASIHARDCTMKGRRRPVGGMLC